MTAGVTELWLEYNQALNRIHKALGRSTNIVSEYAEWLVADAYKGKQLSKTDAACDVLLPDGRTMQVMARMSRGNGAVRLSPIKSWDFDLLVAIIFNEDGTLQWAGELTVEAARELSTLEPRKDSWAIEVDDKFRCAPCVNEVTEYFILALDDGKDDDGLADDPLLRLKNKEFAFTCIKLLKEDSATLERDILALLDSDYCKQTIGHSYAILKKTSGLSNAEISALARDSHGNRRYYESSIPIGDDAYIVSNDWYGLGVSKRDNRSPFVKWVRERV